MQRRVFLKSGALALVTMGLNPSFLQRAAFAADLRGASRRRTLICLFQRGAADALNVLVPHGERAYHALRPSIGIASPSARAGAGGALDLDGFFGLHPALAPLEPLYDRGLLAPIHAVGSPSSTRSHFDAQDYMESATPDVKGTPDGWLNRYLAARGTCEECASPSGSQGAGASPFRGDGAGASPFRAVSLTPQTPRILEGRVPTVAMAAIDEFGVRAPGSDAAAFEALYRTGRADVVHGAGSETFEAVRVLRAADPRRYQPRNGAAYPRSQFGERLKQIAQLIKSDVGVEIAFADVGGWDTHVNQGGAAGQLAARLRDFSLSVAALVTDLGDRMEDVVILTMSEFGRTARENGNRGTDHGHAGVMLAIGGAVKGGRVLGRWPGLEPEQLYEGRDLAMTTDFRAVFSEVASRHLGAVAMDAVFPGYEGGAREWVGVL